jgi:hypothetical protein
MCIRLRQRLLFHFFAIRAIVRAYPGSGSTASDMYSCPFGLITGVSRPIAYVLRVRVARCDSVPLAMIPSSTTSLQWTRRIEREAEIIPVPAFRIVMQTPTVTEVPVSTTVGRPLVPAHMGCVAARPSIQVEIFKQPSLRFYTPSLRGAPAIAWNGTHIVFRR